MLNSQDIGFYRNEEKFQWAQKDILTDINEPTHWQKMEVIVFILGLLTMVFAIYLCLCNSKIIYAALKTVDEIPQVYRTEAAQPSLLQHQNQKQMSIDKSATSLTVIAIVTLHFRHFPMHLKEV